MKTLIKLIILVCVILFVIGTDNPTIVNVRDNVIEGVSAGWDKINEE